MSFQQISHYETGYRFPKLETIHRLAEALGTTALRILEDEPEAIPVTPHPDEEGSKPRRGVRVARFGRKK